MNELQRKDGMLIALEEMLSKEDKLKKELREVRMDKKEFIFRNINMLVDMGIISISIRRKELSRRTA